MIVMFDVTVHRSFSGAHFLRSYQGKCERIHGHNWKVEVTLSGELLNDEGMLYDFDLLKKRLEEVLAPLDHRNLNEVPPFDSIESSAENIATYVARAIVKSMDESERVGLTDIMVRVWETDTNRATYRAAIPDPA